MANTISNDELGKMMDEYAATGKSTINPIVSSNNAPSEAIQSVATKYNIDPRFIEGLAKLETAGGNRVIAGTNNLFNIKDFSGGGTAAYDKIEKSRDKYRQYQNYEQSTEDLIKLLQRKYPAALTAKTPEEFAASLKGYATDPQHAAKLVKMIEKSSNASAVNISTDELGKMMDEYVASQGSSTAKPTKSGTINPTSGKYFAPVDQSATNIDITTPLKVGTSSALHSLTAGFAPEFSTRTEREANPMASSIGSVVGTIPYAYFPGGIPAKMALMGGRAATQAANEEKSGPQIATAGVLDAAAMGAGALAGKVIGAGAQYGSKLLGSKFGPKIATAASKYGEPEQQIVTDIATKGLTRMADSQDIQFLVDAVKKTIPEKNFTPELVKNISNMAQTIVKTPINALPLNVKMELLATALKTLPNVSQTAYRQLLLRLPSTPANETAYLSSMIGKLADAGVKPDAFDAAMKQAYRTYQKSNKFSENTSSILGKVAGKSANIGTTGMFQLSGRSAMDRTGENKN